MKGKARLKIITIFLMVAGVNCGDFLDELKSALEKLQDTVDQHRRLLDNFLPGLFNNILS